MKTTKKKKQNKTENVQIAYLSIVSESITMSRFINVEFLLNDRSSSSILRIIIIMGIKHASYFIYFVRLLNIKKKKFCLKFT